MQLLKKISNFFLLVSVWLRIRRKHFPIRGYSDDVSKCVLISYGRTGSTWLTTLLAYHPQVFNHGEVAFQDMLKSDQRYVKPVSVALFKVLYQMTWSMDELKKLVDTQNDFIVHLTRNPVQIFVSEVIANTTGKWSASVLASEESDITTVEIDGMELLDFIHQYRAKVKQIGDIGSTHPNYLEVKYEDLFTDQGKVTNELQKWLGLDVVELRSALVKQNRFPMSTVVTNYDQIKALLIEDQLDHLLID